MIRTSISLIILIVVITSCSDTGEPIGPGSNTSLANISGAVITDDTQDGIGDVLVRLDRNGNKVDSTYTTESGDFSFEDLSEGDYQVNVVLPQGYEINGTPSKDVTLAGTNVSVNFSAIAIKEQTKTIEQGSVETLTVSSGASITVDATNATSGIEIGIEEVPVGQQLIDGSSDFEYRVTLASDQMQGYPSTSNQLAVGIPIEITQKYFGGEEPSAIRMKFDVGTTDDPFYRYALGQMK